MISNLKITDGDFLMVNIGPTSINQKNIEIVRDHLQKWLSGKGLNNVQLLVGAGFGDILSVIKLSVNDVFEDTVLKGVNKNG